MIAKEDYLKALDIVNQYHEELKMKCKQSENPNKHSLKELILYINKKKRTQIGQQKGISSRLNNVLKIIQDDYFIEDLDEIQLSKMRLIGKSCIDAYRFYVEEFYKDIII